MIVYRKPGLVGLELWNGLSSRGATLYQLRESRSEYFAALREFLEQLRCGIAEAEEDRGTVALGRARGFERVVFCGGEALDPQLEPALTARPPSFTFEIDRSGAYSGKKGAAAIGEEMGWRRWIALDLGQTQLKVMTPVADFCVPRDSLLLPFGARSINGDTGRSRIREVIRDAAGRAAQLMGGSFDGTVLGLPAAIDASGEIQPATYPGLYGPLETVFSGLFEAPTVVLNDAVLAARGFPPNDGAKTLVITLGFGVGGALWE